MAKLDPPHPVSIGHTRRFKIARNIVIQIGRLLFLFDCHTFRLRTTRIDDRTVTTPIAVASACLAGGHLGRRGDTRRGHRAQLSVIDLLTVKQIQALVRQINPERNEGSPVAHLDSHPLFRTIDRFIPESFEFPGISSQQLGKLLFHVRIAAGDKLFGQLIPFPHQIKLQILRIPQGRIGRTPRLRIRIGLNPNRQHSVRRPRTVSLQCLRPFDHPSTNHLLFRQPQIGIQRFSRQFLAPVHYQRRMFRIEAKICRIAINRIHYRFIGYGQVGQSKRLFQMKFQGNVRPHRNSEAATD